MGDYTHSLIFTVALASPLLTLAFVLVKKRFKAGMIFFTLYALVYVVLSLAGKYTIANHGGNDWRKEWSPKGLVYEYTSPAGRSRTEFTMVGAAYWPCIFIDHLLWHRTTEAPQ